MPSLASSSPSLLWSGLNGFFNHGSTQQEQSGSADASSAMTIPTLTKAVVTATAPRSIDELIHRLKCDDLVELSLGWGSGSNGNGGDSPTSSACVTSHHQGNTRSRSFVMLERAIKRNASVRILSIGWRIGGSSGGGGVGLGGAHASGGGNSRRRRYVNKLLRAVVANNNKHLTHLRLVLDDFVAASTLKALLNKHCDTLRVIDIRSLKVVDVSKWKKSKKRTTATSVSSSVGSFRDNGDANSTHSVAGYGNEDDDDDDDGEDKNIVSLIIIQSLQLLKHTKLKVLNLNDCDVTDDTCLELADYLHISGGIAQVSLRCNRTTASVKTRGFNGAGNTGASSTELGIRGLSILCQAPIMHKLDLSLCDIDSDCAMSIASSIAKRPWPLGMLCLNGNYRMGLTALVAFMERSVVSKVRALHLNHCDVTNSRFIAMMETLRMAYVDDDGDTFATFSQPSMSTRILLRELSIQGCRMGGNIAAVTSLGKLLKERKMSVRCLHLNDPSSPNYLSVDHLHVLRDAIQQSNNYEIEELNLDFFKNSKSEHEVWKEIDHCLKLNRVGRRILLKHQQAVPPPLPGTTSLVQPTPTSNGGEIIGSASLATTPTHHGGQEKRFPLSYYYPPLPHWMMNESWWTKNRDGPGRRSRGKVTDDSLRTTSTTSTSTTAGHVDYGLDDEEDDVHHVDDDDEEEHPYYYNGIHNDVDRMRNGGHRRRRIRQVPPHDHGSRAVFHGSGVTGIRSSSSTTATLCDRMCTAGNVDDDGGDRSDWLDVLERAGDDDNELDVLFWIVRETAGRFHRSYRCCRSSQSSTRS